MTSGDPARRIGYRVLAGFLVGFSLVACTPDPGERRDHLFCPSPDGVLTAIFYSRSGGGAAGWVSLYVSLRQEGVEEEVVLFEMGHGYDVVLTWLSASRLRIEYPSDANAFHLRKRFRKRLEEGRVLEVELAKKESENGQFIHDTRRCASSARLSESRG